MNTTYPHTGYAEAVHLALVYSGVDPESTTATVSDPEQHLRDLIITVVWPAGDPALGRRHWPHGMRLVWRHPHGWYVDDPSTLLSRTLPIPPMAAPSALVDIVREHGPTGVFDEEGDPLDLYGSADVWDGAQALDRGLSVWEDLL